MKPRHSRSQRLAAHDHASLTSFRFADDNTITSGSRKHDNVVARFLHRYGSARLAKTLSRERTSPPTRHQKTNTVAIQGMSVEILPPEGKTTTHLGQLIIFEKSGRRELDHRIKCSWAAFTNHRPQMTSRRWPPMHRLNLIDAAVAPSLHFSLGASLRTNPSLCPRFSVSLNHHVREDCCVAGQSFLKQIPCF